MRAASVWAVLLIAAATALAGPSRFPRQLDVDNLSNEALLCFLNASVTGRNQSECMALTPSPNPTLPTDLVTNTNVGPNPVVPGTGCVCTRWWTCEDDLVTALPDGGLLTVVNVRTSQSCSVLEDICCFSAAPTTETEAPPTVPPYVPSCGKRNPTGVGATFAGFTDRQSQYGEFPWMAAVMTSSKHTETNANIYICGASLVHPQAVLTAAHYVFNKTADQLAVRLGEWNFKEPSELIPHQDFLVSRVVIHPDYNPFNLYNDVALLFLNDTAKLGPTVDTICLPEAGQDFSGAECFSSGWGKDMFGKEGKYQQILKSVRLPGVGNFECQEAMRKTRLGSHFNLHDSFMCAGGEAGIDVCTGDGGSPLVCPMASDSTRYVQAGVVAWGIGCGQEGLPGVYASVSHDVGWIESTLANVSGFDVRFGNSGR